jgi:peroxiredoxin family protein
VSALRSDRVAVSFHSADADRLHQGCAIAASAAAAGRPVDLFFFWFALEALASGKLAEAVFPGRDDIAARFEHYDYPSAQALLDAAAPRDAARSAPARPHRV